MSHPTLEQVERLVDAASEADMARDFVIRPDWAAAIRQAVDMLHGVALAAEAEYSYQIYAHDDEEAGERGDLVGYQKSVPAVAAIAELARHDLVVVPGCVMREVLNVLHILACDAESEEETMLTQALIHNIEAAWSATLEAMA